MSRKIFLLLFLAVIAGQGTAVAATPDLFTPEERRWLAEHPQISIVVNGHPAPIAIWNDPAQPDPLPPPAPESAHQGGSVPPAPPRPPQGDISAIYPRPFPEGTQRRLISVGPSEQRYFQGLAADYLEEVGRLTGLTFTVTYRTNHDFRAAFAAMQRGKVDILPAIMYGPQSPPGIVLSAPYVEVPIVVVMQEDAPHFEDVSRLETMNVAGVLPIQKKMDSLGLRTRIQNVTPHDGLLGVATGKYDAFLAELSSISHELRNKPVTNIKITGELPAPSAFSVAVPDRMQEFIPILDKAVRAIPQQKKDEIWERWFPIRYERNPAPGRWLWILGGFSLSTLLLGALGFFYYRGRLRKIRHGIAALEPHLLCVHTDHTITITGVTEALCKVTGFAEEDLVGKPLRILGTPPVQGGGELARLFESVARGSTWQGEVKLVRRDGSEIWTDVIISPTRRKNDQVGYTVIYQDASKRKLYEKLATRDELTGLYNRRHFNALAPKMLEKAIGNNSLFVLFLLDVDNFKQYNDTYGHPAGDRVLTAIGRTLKEMFKRGNECCFRLGGEEFGVAVLAASKEEVRTIAERILRSVRSLRLEHRHNPPGIVTVSIGSAVGTGRDGLRIEDIYKLADANLYTAKESGRDRQVM